MNIAYYLFQEESSDAYLAYKQLHDAPENVQQHFLNKSNQSLTLELYHLTDSILPFLTSEPVFQKLKVTDIPCLPLVLIDNIIVKEGALLTLKELEDLLDVALVTQNNSLADPNHALESYSPNSFKSDNFKKTRQISDLIEIDDTNQLIQLNFNYEGQDQTYLFPFNQLQEVYPTSEHDNPNWQIAALEIVDGQTTISDIDWDDIEQNNLALSIEITNTLSHIISLSKD